jgi:Tfp pilus assembly protein FimV
MLGGIALAISNQPITGEHRQMSEENLGDVLSDNYKQHQRDVAIKTLGGRTHLTIAKISKLLEHPEHGATIGSITLDDLLAVNDGAVVADAPAPAPKTRAKKAAKSKAAPKGKTAKKAAKKAAAAPKAKEKAAAAPKAKEKGGKKPRLNRDIAHKEIKAALKAQKAPCSNGDLVKATKYTPVQVRTFLNELITEGTVTYEGKGRGTKYSLA